MAGWTSLKFSGSRSPSAFLDSVGTAGTAGGTAAMEFSWATDADIVSNSCFVVETTEDLNDLRLGASVQEKCLTCGNTWKNCSGHFGHYRFSEIPVIHPLMVSEARKDLKQWGFSEKIKLSQNALQLYKHGDWKILTFYDIQLFLEELYRKMCLCRMVKISF